jgi:predicted ABC-type ATPase
LDPVGAKLAVFTADEAQAYTVVIIFIGISGPERSDERVAMRVSQGGHDVPPDCILARYPHVLANLRAALSVLSAVLFYDNNDLRSPYRQIAHIECGMVVEEASNVPDWWRIVTG